MGTDIYIYCRQETSTSQQIIKRKGKGRRETPVKCTLRINGFGLGMEKNEAVESYNRRDRVDRLGDTAERKRVVECDTEGKKQAKIARININANNVWMAGCYSGWMARERDLNVTYTPISER